MSFASELLVTFTNGGLWAEFLWLALLFVLLAASLDLAIGFAGQFQLGHIGFFALGALGSTVATHPDYAGLDAVAGILFGALLATVAVAVLAGATLRLGGDHFAIATLGFGIIVQAVLLARYANGIFDVPSLNPAGCDVACIAAHPAGHSVGWLISTVLGFGQLPDAARRGVELGMTLLIVGVAVLLLGRLKRSPWGRSLLAIREDPLAARALGKPVRHLRFQALWVSAMGASLAGSLWVHHLGIMSPVGFSFQFMVLVVAMVIFGGLGSNWGAIIGALTLALIDQISRNFVGWLQSGDGPLTSSSLNLAALRMVLFAALLLAMMMWRPAGLWGGQTGSPGAVVREWWRSRREEKSRE